MNLGGGQLIWRNCKGWVMGSGRPWLLNAHVRYVGGEVALEQVSSETSSTCPANQHSTIAPNLRVTKICDTQHIITSSVFTVKALSPAQHLASRKEKLLLWWHAWAGRVVAYLNHYSSNRLNSPSLLLQLPRVRMPSSRPDGQLMTRGGTVQQGRYLWPKVQVGVQPQASAKEETKRSNCPRA